jgi:hypothetical protein
MREGNAWYRPLKGWANDKSASVAPKPGNKEFRIVARSLAATSKEGMSETLSKIKI